MAVTHEGVYLQNPKTTPIVFTNSDSANTKKTAVTAGTNGTKVVGLFVTSTDTSDVLAQIWLTRSATSYLLASLTVPDLSGTDGTNPTVNLLNTVLWPGLPTDNDGQLYLMLESGDTLQVSFTTQVTAAKSVYVVSEFGNF